MIIRYRIGGLCSIRYDTVAVSVKEWHRRFLFCIRVSEQNGDGQGMEVCRTLDDRWHRRLLKWRPCTSYRNVGRQPTRCHVMAKNIEGDSWTLHEISCVEEAYVKQYKMMRDHKGCCLYVKSTWSHNRTDWIWKFYLYATAIWYYLCGKMIPAPSGIIFFFTYLLKYSKVRNIHMYDQY